MKDSNSAEQTIPDQDDLLQANIAELRKDMVRFATLQLRDTDAAEDAAQEALSAAYSAREQYAGRSQLKTWVFAILRNKIIDILRERNRHKTYSHFAVREGDAVIDQCFNVIGFWHRDMRPPDWGQPEDALNNEQFWRILNICLHAMQENTARVFMMREMLGLETREICQELTISENNCWVILHRARSRLRLCLEDKWLGGSTA